MDELDVLDEGDKCNIQKDNQIVELNSDEEVEAKVSTNIEA